MTDIVAIGFPNKSAKRRALKFDENCDDVEEQLCQDSDAEVDVQVHSSAASKDLWEVLPENVFHSVSGFCRVVFLVFFHHQHVQNSVLSESNKGSSLQLMEKEQETLEEQDPFVLQAKKRQQ